MDRRGLSLAHSSRVPADPCQPTNQPRAPVGVSRRYFPVSLPPQSADHGPILSAVVFDMDGVVTNTARIHATAWKALFDEVIRSVAPEQALFDPEEDYRAHVDGRAREAGVQSFLTARGITVPEGTPDDEPGAFTVHGLAKRKQGFLDEALRRQDVEVFPDTRRLLHRLRGQGTPTALVTSSRNSVPILENAGLTDLFDVRIDGNDAVELGLPGKPDPALFVEAVRRLGFSPEQCAVFEDARSGVHAAHAGGFGLVVGVDRGGAGAQLWEGGADRVLTDVGEMDLHAGWHVGKNSRPHAWLLAYDGFEPDNEHSREALCTLSNGYWGTRGAVPGAPAGKVHYPGTYLAGIFNRVTSQIGDTSMETEHLVKAPDWTFLRVETVDGRTLHPAKDEILDLRQELDMRKGVLRRVIRQRDEQGRITRIVTEQLQSMSDPHLAALRMTVEPENWDGEVRVVSRIDADVTNDNVAEDAELVNRHLGTPVIHHLDGRTAALETTTTQSGVTLALATRTSVSAPDSDPAEGRPSDAERAVGHVFDAELTPGRPLTIEKIAAAVSSRDRALSTPHLDVDKRIRRAGDFDALHADHVQRWNRWWEVFGMELDTTRRNSLALNLHIFHVLQCVASVNPDLDAGVPARGLHGEGYRGQHFWDELFVYPMLTLRQPALTRALLLYRHRRLGEARAAAREAGLRGALFPWRSGSDGREETAPMLLNPLTGNWMPDNSRNQHHIGLAIAYSVWQYYQATDDLAFLTDVGAELIIEVARLFASNAEHNSEEDRYSISGVMGPDEFHDGYPDAPGEGLRDNTYTNVLASWTLVRAAEALAALDPHDTSVLRDRLDITDREMERWEHISRRLRVPFHADGIISQFDGYENLKEFPWGEYEQRYDDLGRLDLILADEGDSPNNYQLSKQADLLMLFYLFNTEELRILFARLGYDLSQDVIERTVEFYLRHTSDGSSLSQLVHSRVMAELDPSRSWAFFEESLQADLSDGQGSSTKEGIHIGAMAGTVDIILRSYGGLKTRAGILMLDPRLPRELPRVGFQVHYRGQSIDVHLTHHNARLRLDPNSVNAVNVAVRGIHHRLLPGDSWELPLAS